MFIGAENLNDFVQIFRGTYNRKSFVDSIESRTIYSIIKLSINIFEMPIADWAVKWVDRGAKPMFENRWRQRSSFRFS